MRRTTNMDNLVFWKRNSKEDESEPREVKFHGELKDCAFVSKDKENAEAMRKLNIKW